MPFGFKNKYYASMCITLCIKMSCNDVNNSDGNGNSNIEGRIVFVMVGSIDAFITVICIDV
jgi:hypothetical protein